MATIDASLIVLTPEGGAGDAIGITTNTEVATEIQIETTDANRLIIKGELKAQKKREKDDYRSTAYAHRQYDCAGSCESGSGWRDCPG